MAHLKVILIATLLMFEKAQPDESKDPGNIDYTDLFSMDESKFASLVDVNKVETTTPLVKFYLIIFDESANLMRLSVF